MKPDLTEIQQKIFNYILQKKQEKGFPPSLAEVAEQFGYSTRATVQQHLEALEKKGYIKRNPRISRGIEVLEDTGFLEKSVLGEVAAGNPLTIYPDAIDTVELPSLIKMPKGSFLLKVKGDSLKDAYIFNGDLVIVKSGIEPRNGQIIVGVLDNASIVKKFIKKNNSIELHSENEEFKPIIINSDYENFRVVGIVIGIYRSMEKK